MNKSYKEKLKEIQNIFCEGTSELLTIHINYIHETFKDKKKANRYIREMKLNTLDKLPDLYNLMQLPAVQKGDIKVEMKDEFKAENLWKSC